MSCVENLKLYTVLVRIGYKSKMGKKQYILFFLFILIVVLGSLFVFKKLTDREDNYTFRENGDNQGRKTTTITKVVNSNETLYQILGSLGFSSGLIYKLSTQAKPVYDLSRMISGTQLQIEVKSNTRNQTLSQTQTQDQTQAQFQEDLDKTQLEIKDEDFISLKVFLNEASYVLIEKDDTLDSFNFKVSQVELPVDIELVSFSNTVSGSLWESAKMVGMDSSLIIDLSDIFAWQIDFAREVRNNDSWIILVEKKSVDSKFIGWGKILAAQYFNQGTTYTGVYYSVDGKGSYYAPDGSSLRRIFLKSPLKYSRISSKFSRSRFHPVLKIARPHNGVDYAAPIGTPVMSVGDGTVSFAGRKGPSGIMVKIKHNSVYSTAYLHLRNVAKGIKKGTRVKQAQVIGYVGMTGSTSGPHCHFSFYENSRFVDPLGRKFPAQAGIPKARMFDFMNHTKMILDKLSSSDLALSKQESKNL